MSEEKETHEINVKEEKKEGLPEINSVTVRPSAVKETASADAPMGDTSSGRRVVVKETTGLDTTTGFGGGAGFLGHF